MMTCWLTLSSYTAFAQSNDDTIRDLTFWSSDRGYNPWDENAAVVTAKTDTSVTFEVPVAKKEGKSIVSYYITRWPISYQEMMSSQNTDDLAKIKTSDDTTATWGEQVYKVVNDKLILTLPIDSPTDTIYVSVVPEDDTMNLWRILELKPFQLNTLQVTTTTNYDEKGAGASFSNPALNQAIDNVTCVWDATANRTTLFRDVNTALQASTVEISYRADEQQWSMVVVGKPAIRDNKFIVDTAHRNIQLFNLKPLDSNGTKIGNDIQYICKPNPVAWPVAPITPTNPSKPIPVTPATWPVETAAVVLVIAILGYALYRKVRKA